MTTENIVGILGFVIGCGGLLIFDGATEIAMAWAGIITMIWSLTR